MNTSYSMLPAIEEKDFSGEPVQTCNARELHQWVENGQEFRHWIKNRIEQYGFVENQDFVTSENFIRGGTAVDYYITLDMAKELAMVERNEKGKLARQYFLECEKRAKSNVVDISKALADPEKLRSMLLGYTRYITLPSTVEVRGKENPGSGPGL